MYTQKLRKWDLVYPEQNCDIRNLIGCLEGVWKRLIFHGKSKPRLVYICPLFKAMFVHYFYRSHNVAEFLKDVRKESKSYISNARVLCRFYPNFIETNRAKRV